MARPKIVSYLTLKKKRKFIPEMLGLIMAAFSLGLIGFLSWYSLLTPFGLFGILLIHTGVILYTKYSEFDPPPILHFFRPFQGLLLISPLLLGLAYFFTFFTQGDNLESSIKFAQFSTQITLLMLIWAFLSTYSIIGVYFSLMTISRWFPFLVQLSGQFDTPLILYFDSIFVALMGLGCWFT
ncbi:MAG: hypothetical protein DRO88_06095, partial [Promethearchaeia archaeon]